MPLRVWVNNTAQGLVLAGLARLPKDVAQQIHVISEDSPLESCDAVVMELPGEIPPALRTFDGPVLDIVTGFNERLASIMEREYPPQTRSTYVGTTDREPDLDVLAHDLAGLVAEPDPIQPPSGPQVWYIDDDVVESERTISYLRSAIPMVQISHTATPGAFLDEIGVLKSEPTLVITDIFLGAGPGGAGTAVEQLARDVRSRGDIPLIAFSAYHPDPSTAAIFDAVVPKSAGLNELVRTVLDILGDESSGVTPLFGGALDRERSGHEGHRRKRQRDGPARPRPPTRPPHRRPAGCEVSGDPLRRRREAHR